MKKGKTSPKVNDSKKQKSKLSYSDEIPTFPVDQIERTSALTNTTVGQITTEKTIKLPATKKAELSSKPDEKTKEEKWAALSLDEKVRRAREGVSDLDNAWNKFKDDFDEALGGMVGIFGRSMGAPQFVLEDLESVSKEDRLKVLNGNPNLEHISAGLKSGRYKNVVVMTGAGMSTAAGIPDFRSPDKGLYATLKKSYPELNRPEDIFDLSYYKENPKPFCKLCRELDLCGVGNAKYKPTKAHYLSLLLSKKKILRRVYTQNIDGLDLATGLPPKLLVEAHGGGRSASCVECGEAQDVQQVRKVIQDKGVPKCKKCSGLCKPDITFFGEDLPKRFAELKEEDFSVCDLLIVMGTSLKVAPFCNLVADVGMLIPRLLINLSEIDGFFLFKHEKNYRDVFEKNTCDAGVQRLVDLCGWKSSFSKLTKNIREKSSRLKRNKKTKK